jgi:O-antigen ligase
MFSPDSMADRERTWPILIAATASLAIVFFAMLFPGGMGADNSWCLFVELIPAVLLAALLLPPSVPLILAIVILESPFGLDTEITRSTSYITGGLILWTVLASFISASRPKKAGSNVVLGKFWFFAAYGILGALHGLRLGNSREYVVGDLFQIEEFAIVFILVTRVIVDETTLRRLMVCALGSTFLTSVLQLAGYGTFDSVNPELSALEGRGRTIDLNAIFVLLTALSLYAGIRGSRHRILLWVLMIATTANLAMSFTRGIWVAAVAAIVVCLRLLPRVERRRIYRAAVIAALCFALFGGLWNIGSSAADGSLLAAAGDRLLYGVTQMQQGLGGDVAVETRRFVEIATIAPQIMKAPLLGNGLGGFYWIDMHAFINEQGLGTIDFHYMHNLYLLVGFRLGLIGLATFVGILYFYFRESIRGYRKMPAGPRKALVAGLIAGVAGEVVLSMTSPTILNHPTSALTACVMALTFRLQDLPPGGKEQLAGLTSPIERALKR